MITAASSPGCCRIPAMEPVQELRERQRLYVPTRSAVRPAGTPSAGAGEPWASDYPWRPEGQEPDYAPSAGRPVLVRLVLLVLIGLANLALLSSSLLLENIVIILDLFAVVIFADMLLKLWLAFRHRPPRLRWKTFPAFVGGRLEAVLVARPALEPIGPVHAVLRCVQDERVPPAQGSEEISFEPTAIYRQIAEIPVPEDKLRELPMSFEIPPGLPGTDLGRDEAIYWQIALRIPMIGPDLETVFLAPVYARRP